MAPKTMRIPSEGLQVVSKKPLAMSNFFPRIHRCRISNVLKLQKIFIYEGN
jgi:hypothetical protein